MVRAFQVWHKQWPAERCVGESCPICVLLEGNDGWLASALTGPEAWGCQAHSVQHQDQTRVCILITGGEAETTVGLARSTIFQRLKFHCG